jgi:hypothetical protein
MIEIAAITGLVSAISATIILCLLKWHIIEWLEIHYSPVCRFCLGFWLCALQTLLIYIFYNQNLFDIAVPFAGAAITWKLRN